MKPIEHIFGPFDYTNENGMFFWNQSKTNKVRFFDTGVIQTIVHREPVGASEDLYGPLSHGWKIITSKDAIVESYERYFSTLGEAMAFADDPDEEGEVVFTHDFNKIMSLTVSQPDDEEDEEDPGF